MLSFDNVPKQRNCRWFVRYGSTIRYDRGFRSKKEAAEWINGFGNQIDCRVNFWFRLKGDDRDIEIIDRQGRSVTA